MKILHLTYSDNYGGASIAAKRIHFELLKRGKNSTLITVDRKCTLDPTIVEVPYKFGRLEKFVRPYFSEVIKKLFKKKLLNSFNIIPSSISNYINKLNVDIVNLHWVNNEMISIKDISNINKPLVWTFHDMWPFCSSEHYTATKDYIYSYNKLNYSIFNISKYVWSLKLKYWKKYSFNTISTSKWLFECTKKSFLFKKKKNYLIYNCSDHNYWNIKNKNFSRKKLGLPINKKIILFGAVNLDKDHRKGFDVVVKNFELLQKEYDNSILAVFGNIKKHKDSKLIKYFGYINKDSILRDLYNASDLMLAPSTLENIPLTCMDAMCCGLPIISTKTGGFKEIIVNNINGHLIDNINDSKNFIEKIMDVLDKKTSYKNRKIIRNFAIKLFSPKKTIDSYLDIYNKIILK
jgi:glycosyltransferase involved in cell wall biosynthesis